MQLLLSRKLHLSNCWKLHRSLRSFSLRFIVFELGTPLVVISFASPFSSLIFRSDPLLLLGFYLFFFSTLPSSLPLQPPLSPFSEPIFDLKLLALFTLPQKLSTIRKHQLYTNQCLKARFCVIEFSTILPFGLCIFFGTYFINRSFLNTL